MTRNNFEARNKQRKFNNKIRLGHKKWNCFFCTAICSSGKWSLVHSLHHYITLHYSPLDEYGGLLRHTHGQLLTPLLHCFSTKGGEVGDMPGILLERRAVDHEREWDPWKGHIGVIELYATPPWHLSIGKNCFIRKAVLNKPKIWHQHIKTTTTTTTKYGMPACRRGGGCQQKLYIWNTTTKANGALWYAHYCEYASAFPNNKIHEKGQ